MRIRVDRAICAGHALCALRAPEIYLLDEEGYCISDGQDVPADQEEKAAIGAANCPEGAITLSED